MKISTTPRVLQHPESSQGENRQGRAGCPHSDNTTHCADHQSSHPPIGIHDRFNQQSKSLELSEIKVFYCLIKATIHPLAIAFLVNREVLIQRLTPNAVGESIVMQELGRMKLQRHAS